MRNEYQYIDPDSVYIDRATGVLRNLGGITDRAALTFAETAATTKRAHELKTSPNDLLTQQIFLEVVGIKLQGKYFPSVNHLLFGGGRVQ